MLTSFENASEPEKLGNKAKNLILLHRAGFCVPNGFVLGSECYDEFVKALQIDYKIDELLASINPHNIIETATKLCSLFESAADLSVISKKISGIDPEGRYAVRSSGTLEDTDNYSFAGQYDTVLNVSGTKELCTAVVSCYKSMFSSALLSYICDNGLDASSLKMSVIIQEMVHADFSGVAFTVDPVNGFDKTIVIEAAEGTGDALVSGKVEPERYYCSNFSDDFEFTGGGTLFNGISLQKAVTVFAKIQEFFGFPCDIEFAVAENKLFILQARAVTKIGYARIEDIWTTADFKDGGVSAYVCTPLMWSLYEYIWDYALKKFVLDSKILKKADVKKDVGKMFFGRPYWNLSTVKKAMSSIPGYKEREFDSEYGIRITYDGDGSTTGITPGSLLKIAVIAAAQKKILKERRDNNDNYKAALLAKQRYYSEGINDSLSDSELAQRWIRLTKEDYLFSESTYFRQIFINTIHQALYKSSLLKYVSESGYLGLLGGINNISHLLPFYSIWETSRIIRQNKKNFDYWTNSTTDDIARDLESGIADNCLSEVKQFIADFGYHSDRELDVTYPCYCEEPKTVIEMFRDSVMLDDSCSPVEDKLRQKKEFEARLSDIKNKVSAKKFKKLSDKIDEMRKMLWWREEFRDISTRFYYSIRIWTLRLAKSLEANGIIEKADDIRMLKVRNLWDYFDGNTTEAELKKIAQRNRSYYNSFRNYTSDNEIGSVFSREEKQSITEKTGICGLGCCSGIITARARVVNGLEDIGRLEKGDILVTKYTDTGWTGKFAMLSGIVTEYGGILCHAAIVSREYGIPCIVCVRDAMKLIRDGSVITIDGSSGEILTTEEGMNE